ncbi:MAG: hypothetical protein ACLQLG_05120 [Thermoguttaceae bacterium]
MYLDQSACRSIVAGAVLFAVCSAGCGESRNKAAQEQEAARREEVTQRQIAELAKKHGAKTDWMNSAKDTDHQVFALELQQAIDPFVGHPVLLTGMVRDVYRTKDGYGLMCSPDPDGSEAWRTTYFVLDVTEDTARRLLASKPDSFQRCAVVFIPSRVSVTFREEAQAHSPDDEQSGEDYELTRRLWVRGKCVDAEFLPTYSF